MFQNNLLMAAAANASGGAAVVPPVKFDGSNDYMQYSGDPMPNGTTGTFSCWFKFNASSTAPGPEAITYFYLSAGTFFDIRRSANGSISIIYYDAGSSQKGNFKTSTSFAGVSSSWHHLCASWNTATTTQHLFVDGVSDITQITNATGTIDYTRGTHNLGSGTSGADKINADLAQFYITNEYIDLSNATNLAKFISTDGTPVDMGTDGATPTGTAARLFFNSAVDSWHTNDGTGGGFTEYGALTAGSEPVEL